MPTWFYLFINLKNKKMARIKKGILGGFAGKVGTVIGSNWKGVDYIRSLPKASSKPATLLQTDQRLRFAAVMGFLRPIGALINKGYRGVTGARTPMNAAMSYHVKNALTGISPDFVMDYSKVVFSKGDIAGAWAPEADSVSAAQLTFSWQNNSGTGLAEEDDEAILLVYNSEKNQYVFLETGETRITGTVNLLLPSDFSGDEVDCWISFKAVTSKRMATSVYIGKAVVS